ncbi:hypothetical protein [Streptomyces sp. 8N616]|uniref:hypothetical protein n=1 Tax=Streptomyces sp. 8N616 TaxID=3457414 RepID=UPI003FD3B741
MRSRPARIAALAALLGGFLIAAPAEAAPTVDPPADPPAEAAPTADAPTDAPTDDPTDDRNDAPDCTVRSKRLAVTVDREAGTATATGRWHISCRSATVTTAELKVLAPRRAQKPLKGSYGTRFQGYTSVTGPADPENPELTAVLTLKAGDKVLGKPIRECATRPDGSPSCYPGRDDSPDMAADVLHFLGVIGERSGPDAAGRGLMSLMDADAAVSPAAPFAAR